MRYEAVENVELRDRPGAPPEASVAETRTRPAAAMQRRPSPKTIGCASSSGLRISVEPGVVVLG